MERPTGNAQTFAVASAVALGLWSAIFSGRATAAPNGELQLLSVTKVALERPIEMNVSLERGRCYVIALKLGDGASIASAVLHKRVLAAELHGRELNSYRLPIDTDGGHTERICPLETGKARLRVYRSLLDLVLGRGVAEVEIWSRRLTPTELRAEVARQRDYLAETMRQKQQWQRATAQSPACDACDRQRDRCSQRGGDAVACGPAWADCRTDHGCR